MDLRVVRLRATLLAMALVGVACSPAGWRPAAASEPQTFVLRPGESALSADGAVRVGFEGVSADSRCPKGERCVRAGDATARVWLQHGAGLRLAFDLHTAPGPAQAARSATHEVFLLQLDPYPVTGRPLGTAESAATLMLRCAQPTVADR